MVKDKEPQHIRSVKVQQIDNAPNKKSNKDDNKKLMKSQGFMIKFKAQHHFIEIKFTDSHFKVHPL